ncbi:MAG: OmpH family outer membrane protein [Terriglobales bacterium]
MRLRLIAFFMGCALAATALAGAQAPAAAAALPPAPTATGPTRLAFINFQQAIAETAQGAKLVAALKTRFAPRQAQLEKSNAQLRALEKRLQDGSSTMSQDAKLQLNQEIQSQQRDLQQSAQDAQTDYQSAAEGVVNKVGAKMLPLIQGYAKQHGLSLVLDSGLRWPQSPMLYEKSGTDITAAVVQLYNQRYPAASN